MAMAKTFLIFWNSEYGRLTVPTHGHIVVQSIRARLDERDWMTKHETILALSAHHLKQINVRRTPNSIRLQSQR